MRNLSDREDLSKKVVRASFWTVASRWAMRSLGFVSLIILARLLQPEDYGIMAMAMAFIGLIELFKAWGFQMAIVRHPDPKREHYDTAWTLQLLNGIACAAIMALAAAVVADFFNEPRLELVILVLSLSSVIHGFANIGLADLQRNFRFSTEFRYLLTTRLVRFGTTVTLAFILQNYWALVIGQLIGGIAGVILGYVFVPRWPRPTLAVAAEILPFSFWMVIRNFAIFVTERFDTVMVARLYSTDLVGPYDLAKNTAQYAIAESLLPLSRALLPGFAKITEEQQRLLSGISKATGVYATLGLPMGIGLAAIAPEFVLVVLGPKWSPALPFLIVFALGAGVRFLPSPLGPLLLAQGRSRTVACMMCLQALIFMALVSCAAFVGDVVWIAAATLATAIITTPIQIRLGLGSWAWTGWMLKPAVRPLIAASLMAVAVLSIGTLALPAELTLVAKILVGVIVYTGSILVLWTLAGRPQGAEQIGVDLLSGLRRVMP